MDNKLLDITPKTLVGEMLEVFPQLEDKLIEIAPVFKKLKNPILRKTVAKVATLKQAATIAEISVGDLINTLRKEAGLDQLEIAETGDASKERPAWLNPEKIKFTYDASIDLENGIHPAAKVTKEILQLENEDIYTLVTPFIPAPLIKIVEERGYNVYSEKIDEGTVNTYIINKSQ